MEVFIPFDGNLELIPLLEASLDAWATVRFAKPQVIELPQNSKFVVRARVIADGLAKGDHYIFADLDAIPEETYVVSAIIQRIAARLCHRAKEEREFAMALIRPRFDDGGRVRVLLKNVLKKWPSPSGRNYDDQYSEAIIHAGYSLETWDDIWYRQLPLEPTQVN